MTNDVVACWTSRNKLPTRKRSTVLRYSCSGIFFSFHNIHFYLMLANIATYLNILIWFSIEVLHHAFHLQKKDFRWNCYIAENLFPTARALIGYFEVTWHLTMKLFPAKISERATLQNLWRQRLTVHNYPRMLSWPTTAVTARFYEFSASKFRLRQHWDSRETKLTVSLGTS